MQPYRNAKPHTDDCEQCSELGEGHRLCQHGVCGSLAEGQYQRHATPEEFAAIPEGLRPIDGVAHRAVFVCAGHGPGPAVDVHAADCEGHGHCLCDGAAPSFEKYRPPSENPAEHAESLRIVHEAEMAFYKKVLMEHLGDTDAAAEHVRRVFGGLLEQARQVQSVKDHDSTQAV